MNEEKHILPDDLFRKNLESMEEPYDGNAWQNMADLLDKSDRKHPFLLWFRKNKKTTLTTLIITIMTTASIFTALTLLVPNNNAGAQKLLSGNGSAGKNTHSYSITKENTNKNDDNSVKTFYVKPGATLSQNDESNSTQNTSSSNKKGDNKTGVSSTKQNQKIGDRNTASGIHNLASGLQKQETISANNNANNAGEKSTSEKENVASNTNQESDTGATHSENKKSDVPTIKTLGTATKNITPKNNAPMTTLKDYSRNDGPFKGFWMGIHFTMQYPQIKELQDSFRQNAGFNMQFMSGNLTGRRDFSAYMGFDFGMQFTGRGKNYGVALDNTTQDSGFTRLSNHSFDFFARSHFEYDKFRLKPYVNLFGGPRIFATSQYTEAYHQKTNYDNSSNTNAFTSASLMYGAGVGVRYRISKVVSLDARLEYMRGTQTQMVNVDKSTFNGLTAFNLSKFSVTPEYKQLKVGFLFDLGPEEEPVHKDETTEETQYYKYDSTTNSYIKVNCSCRQWTVSDTNAQDSIIVIKKRTNYYYDPNQPSYNPGKSRGSSFPRGGGGGGGSRGSFPGLHPGGGGIRPKS